MLRTVPVLCVWFTVVGGVTAGCANIGEPAQSDGACGHAEQSACDAGPQLAPDGGADARGVDAAPEPAAVSLTIAGHAMQILDTWYLDDQYLFIEFEGPDFGVGSDINVILETLGEGCAASVGTGNDIWLRPDIDNLVYPTQYQSNSPSCGLAVSELPSSGGRAVGSFEGTLDALNGLQPPTVAVSLAFDVPFPDAMDRSRSP